MARDTKIGLLVGMTFIICFAIILSNRSGDTSGGSIPLYRAWAGERADSGRSGVTLTERRIRERARSATSMLDAAAQPQDDLDPSTARISDPARSTRDATMHTGDPSHERVGRSSFSSGTTPPSEFLRDTPVATNEGAQAGGPPGDERAVLSAVSHPDQPPLEPVLPAGWVEGTSPSVRSAAELVKPAADKAGARTCVVRKGETLARIARTHYGLSTKNVIDAIFEANRDRLRGADSVREGQVLILPDVDGTGGPATTTASPPRSGPAASNPSEARTKPGESDRGSTKSSKPWRWYQVQKGDILTTIAQRELGTSKRWGEVFELNKDIFPVPGKIRSGVRIRLPVERMGAGTEGPST